MSPLRSDAPDFLGAQWVPIRPNTDTAMMLAMAHTLLAEERYDAQFVSRHCAGFEAFRRYLLGLDDGVREKRGLGGARSPASPPTRCAISRAAPPRPAA